MRRVFPVFLITLGLCFFIGLQAEAEEQHRGSEVYLDGKHHYVPKDGFVPDEETAIKIAEAVWHPIYGTNLNDEHPFRAQLNKVDGKILRISHGE